MPRIDPLTDIKNPIAQYLLSSRLESEPGEVFKTPIFIGTPYQENGEWFCEEHVVGFSCRKVSGESSLQALASALCVARIDVEMLDCLGHKFFIPEKPELTDNDELIPYLFGLSSSKYRLELIDPNEAAEKK